jgi:uncharacterized protein YfaS (alpha-2-macroglobulin family)
MRKCRVLFLFICLFSGMLLLAAMGGRPDADRPEPAGGAALPADAPPAYVTKVSIQDTEILKGKKAAVVTFSAPMVAAEKVSEPVAEADGPFVIRPAISGEGCWVTESSFAFLPEKEFRRGVQYFLHLKDDLKTLDGKPARYLIHFRSKSVVLSSLDAESYDRDKQTLVLTLNFDQPVKGAALEEHLSVRDKDGGEILPYALKSGGGPNSRHKLHVSLGRPRSALEVILRADADADRHYLGLAQDHAYSLSPPAPGAAQAKATAKRDGAPSDVKIYNRHSWQSDGELYARFDLSERLRQDNYREYISVEPEGLPYTLDDYGDELRFREGLKPGMRISVTLKPGLADMAGRVLAEDRGDSLTVRDYEATARFAQRGSYLSPAYGSRLGVNLVNADRVSVSLRRQYDNNLPFMTLEPQWWVKDLMRRVGIRELTITDGKKNEVRRRALDVADLAGGRRGVFVVTLDAYAEKTSDGGKTCLELENRDEQLVVLTDIGVTARVFPSGITVFAAGLSTAKPLAEADVRVYSASNQLIAQGKTGPDGIFAHGRGMRWDPQLTPSVVTVQSGVGEEADLTFLSLEGGAHKEIADTALRDYLEDTEHEAFVYTPRGVFRPGERVDLKAFVRNSGHLPPDPFPVLFRVVSSRDLEAARGSVMLSSEGGADFSFTLPPTAPTGEYRAAVTIPGQKEGALGACVFSVEEFTPPRLEVSLAPGEETLLSGKPLPVALSGRYLFGAPGAELNYELGYRATAKAFTPNGWDGYAFGDGERRFDAQADLQYLRGKLDGGGLAEAAFKAPDAWLPPALLDVRLVASVQEDGGRWVTQTSRLTYFPSPFLLGLKQEEEKALPGAPVAMRAAAVDASGAQVDAGALKAEISLIRGAWHTVYRNKRYVSLWDERLIAQEAFPLEAKNGAAAFRFTPGQSGWYLVRVSTADGAVVASRRIRVAEGDASAPEDGSGRLDSVELSFDKADYRVGETARLSVKAPYAGTLLLGIERGPQLSSRVIPLERPSTVVDIPVSADMDPNAVITAWVIRPLLEENREWFAHRAYGMIPLMISKAPHRLRVIVETPARTLPGKPLSVSFSVADAEGRPVQGEFSAALIDEGVLSLTAFATPDPAEFFLSRRRAVSESFDMYDALLRPEAKATPLLAPGGDAAQYYEGSLGAQRIYLTAWQPVVRTDARGRGEARFEIPEYSGKGRLMIVGASGDLFASSSSEIRVARDLELEVSAPRVVAPGDGFEIACTLFALAGDDGVPLSGDAEAAITAEGPLALGGDLKTSLPLTAARSAAEKGTAPLSRRLTVTADALGESGVGTVTIAVTVPGREDLSFSRRIEVLVRPPYPRTSATATALIASGGSAVLSVPGEWLKGSVQASFSLDRSPALAILPALEYLREYPYGCLEQTTSRAWPWLVLPAMRELSGAGADAAAEAGNARAVLADSVARIASMQSPEGGFGLWPGRYAPDPWKSVNAAFFLVEAKAVTAVPKSVLDDALGYLRVLLAAKPSEEETAYDYSVKAYAAFVLTRAGEAPLSWLQHLSGHENGMLPSGRIFLAGAKALTAGNSAALKALEAKGAKAFALNGANGAYSETMESELRNISLRLLMWSLVEPSAPEAAQLCVKTAEGFSGRRSFTTQEAGMASLALGRYLEHTGMSGKPHTAKIAAGDAPLAEVADGARLILSGARLPLSADGQPPALSVTMGDAGQAYAVYSVRGAPMQAPEPVSSHLTAERVWKDAKGNPIVPDSGVIRVKKGERVIAELTLAADMPLSHIALSDLLPGGLEVENPRLKTAAAAVNDAETRAGGEERPEGAGEEEEEAQAGSGKADAFFLDLREDRLLLFFDRLSGEKTYRYSMRAVSRGRFALPPLAADGMYDPDIRATDAAGLTVIVE